MREQRPREQKEVLVEPNYTALYKYSETATAKVVKQIKGVLTILSLSSQRPHSSFKTLIPSSKALNIFKYLYPSCLSRGEKI